MHSLFYIAENRPALQAALRYGAWIIFLASLGVAAIDPLTSDGDIRFEWLFLLIAFLSMKNWTGRDWVTPVLSILICIALGLYTLHRELARMAMEKHNGVLLFGPESNPYEGLMVYGLIPGEVLSPAALWVIFPACILGMIKILFFSKYRIFAGNCPPENGEKSD